MMETKGLKRSIYTIGGLVLLIIFQHLITIFHADIIIFEFANDFCVLVLFMIFLAQLVINFKLYLKVENIKMKIMVLGISYSFMLVLAEIIKFTVKTSSDNSINSLSFYTAGLIFLIFLVFLIIICGQYIRIGNVFYKINLKEMKRLAYSMYFMPLMFAVILVFPIFEILKPYQQIFIIIELSPYWFVYKIYKKILNGEFNADLIRSSETSNSIK